MKNKLFIVSLVLVFLLTACGGGSGPSTSLDVTFTEFQFTPNAFTVPAGQTVTLNVRNNGAVVHQFVVMNLGVSVGDDFSDDDRANIYWQVEVEPGGSKSVTFTAPAEPGEYRVVCGTPGHYVAGMIGTLTVVAGQ